MMNSNDDSNGSYETDRNSRGVTNGVVASRVALSSLSLSEQKRLPPDFLAHHIQLPAPGYRPSRPAVQLPSAPSQQQHFQEPLSDQNAVVMAMDSTGRVDDALVEEAPATSNSEGTARKLGLFSYREWKTSTKVSFLAMVVLVIVGATVGTVLAISNSKHESSNIEKIGTSSTTTKGEVEPSTSPMENLVPEANSALADPWTLVSTLKAPVDESDNNVDTFFGINLAISKDGATLAAHHERIDQSSFLNSGPVFAVYATANATAAEGTNDTSSSTAGEKLWIQRGSQITGECPCRSSMYTLALSRDGNTLAIGGRFFADADDQFPDLIHVYDDNGTDWVQREILQIDGEFTNEVTISLDGDGSLLAFGLPTLGIARVFEWKHDENMWIQRGEDFLGKSLNDNFGFDVSLSEDGLVLAVAAKGSNEQIDVDAEGAGEKVHPSYVDSYVWHVETADQWTAIASIDYRAPSDYGSQTFDYTATSVSLSSDGSVLAVGLPRNTIHPNEAVKGRVEVFEREDKARFWYRRGLPISGTNAGSRFGDIVDLSSDGTIIAVAVPESDINGVNSGQVRVFYWDSTKGRHAWVQVGNDLNGENFHDKFGRSLALSSPSNGTTIIAAAGAPSYTNNQIQNSGRIQLFQHAITV